MHSVTDRQTNNKMMPTADQWPKIGAIFWPGVDYCLSRNLSYTHQTAEENLKLIWFTSYNLTINCQKTRPQRLQTASDCNADNYTILWQTYGQRL